MKARERYLLYLADSHLFLGLQLLDNQTNWKSKLGNLPLGLIGAEYLGFARELYRDVNLGSDNESILQTFRNRQSHETRNLCLVEFPTEKGFDLVVRSFLLDSYCHVLCTLWLDNSNGVFYDFALHYLNRLTDRLSRSTESLLWLANQPFCTRVQLQRAVDRCWPYTLEFFIVSDFERTLLNRQDLPPFMSIQREWLMTVRQVFFLAKIEGKESGANLPFGKTGKHTTNFSTFVDKIIQNFEQYSLDLLAG